MHAKKLENFKEALVCQYRDLIKEAILESECEHRSRLNIGTLNNKLNMICKAAKYDGLGESTINQLIDEATAPAVHKAAA